MSMGMTKEGFRKYLERRVTDGKPFLAYWHPDGHGLMLTGTITLKRYTYKVWQGSKVVKTCHDSDSAEVAAINVGGWVETEAEDYEKKIPATHVKRWRKQIEWLRRERGGTMIVAEYDGKRMTMEGDTDDEWIYDYDTDPGAGPAVRPDGESDGEADPTDGRGGSAEAGHDGSAEGGNAEDDGSAEGRTEGDGSTEDDGSAEGRTDRSTEDESAEEGSSCRTEDDGSAEAGSAETGSAEDRSDDGDAGRDPAGGGRAEPRGEDGTGEGAAAGVQHREAVGAEGRSARGVRGASAGAGCEDMNASGRAHALLSPSSASRWIHCPPSALLNQTTERRDTPYTREGTLAHAVAELKGRKYFLGGIGPKKYDAAMKRFKADEMWQDEMDGHTDTWLEALKDCAAALDEPFVTLEARVNFSDCVPDGFGTADCLMIGGSVLHVIDFKYGQGVPVDARHNPQLMLYALGALNDYDAIYDIETVRMSIVQPRIYTDPETRQWECSADELRAWAETVVKPAAALAIRGEGEYAEGDWCRFCAARQTCRARAEAQLRLAQIASGETGPRASAPAAPPDARDAKRGGAQSEFKLPPELSDAEVADALRVGARLKAWLSDLEDYALGACLDGREIPGFKAVAGRSVRAWSDPEGAFDAARAAGVPDAMLYERKPVTLAALEKAMGKKPFAEALGAFVTTPPGKPTLVEASDKRPAIINKTSAKDDFGEEDELPF